MTDPVVKLRAVARALELCRVCESKLTGDTEESQGPLPSLLDLPIPEHDQEQSCETRGRKRTARPDTPVSSPERASSLPQTTPEPGGWQPPNDVSYKRCFINNVRMVDCDLQAFTIKDCDLEGVTFRDCNFSNVVFEDLKLKNVTFVNLDFRNVWLRDIKWICALWDGYGLANAFVAGYNFLRNLDDEKRPKLILPLKAGATNKNSKTRILEPARAWSAKAVQDGESKIICQEAKVELLQLPDKVMDAILEHLFPRSPEQGAHAIMMSDLPTSVLDTACSQGTYTTRSPFGFRSAPFTYHGWPCPSAITSPTNERQPVFHLGFCLPFLLASKRFYELAITHIYDRRLHFDDKPERCVAFLKDHQAPEHKLLAIALRYTSQTDPVAWHQLLQILRDDKSAINELTVELSSEFWSSSLWRGKCWPESLISWKGWAGNWQQQPLNSSDSKDSFLELVAKLPGERFHSGKVPRKAEDVRFFFGIQGAKGFPSREAFVDEVQTKLRMRMLAAKEKGAKADI